jgi:hypothetical protein
MSTRIASPAFQGKRWHSNTGRQGYRIFPKRPGSPQFERLLSGANPVCPLASRTRRYPNPVASGLAQTVVSCPARRSVVGCRRALLG